MVQNSTLTHCATRMLAHSLSFIGYNLCACFSLYRVYTVFGRYVARFCSVFFLFFFITCVYFLKCQDVLITAVKKRKRKKSSQKKFNLLIFLYLDNAMPACSFQQWTAAAADSNNSIQKHTFFIPYLFKCLNICFCPWNFVIFFFVAFLVNAWQIPADQWLKTTRLAA